jgi:PAS domain S-box-containing protein
MNGRRDYSVFDSLGVGVQVMDHDWRYLYLNDLVVQQSGFTREQLLGQRFPDMYPGVESTKLFAALKLCLDERRETSTTNDFTFPDGSKRYFELRVHPLPEGMLICSTDVTEATVRQLILEDLKDEFEGLVAQRTTELAARNRELLQLNYLVSHDLQAPLRTIRQFAGLMLHTHADALDEDGMEQLRRIERAGGRLQSLVAGILEHGRIGSSSEIREVDTAALIADICSDLQETLDRSGGAVHVGAMPAVPALPSELRTLFQNLVENALKYARPGVPPRVEVGAERSGGTWQFAVRDNGVGIPAEHRRRIFDLFGRVSTDPSIEGTGLGLAHCEKVVGLHGGRIWVESTPGVGSTFYFTLAPEHAA